MVRGSESILFRIIAIQPSGAAFQAGVLRVGQLIQQADGISLKGSPIISHLLITILGLTILNAGLSHEGAARLIAERYALRDRPDLVLVVMDHKPTPAERRRAPMLPQS